MRPDDERKLLVGCAVTNVSMLFVVTSFRIEAAECHTANRVMFTIANGSFANESKYVRQAVKCQDATHSSPRMPGLLVEQSGLGPLIVEDRRAFASTMQRTQLLVCCHAFVVSRHFVNPLARVNGVDIQPSSIHNC